MSCDLGAEDDVKLLIRKLRKKLRQIENLERLKRPLTVEEKIKIQEKDSCRNTLLSHLDLASKYNISVNTSCDLDDEEEVEGDPRKVEDVGAVEDKKEGSDLVLDHTELDQILAIDDSKEETSLNNTSPPPEAYSAIDIPKSKRKRGSSKKVEKQKCQEIMDRYSNYSWLNANYYSEGVCLSSNEEFYVSGSKDTTARVWNNKGELCHTLGDHTSTVTAVLLSPDGSNIITACHDCSLRVWDTKTGRLTARHYLYSPIRCAVSDDSCLLIGTEGGKLQLYSLMDISLLWEKIAHDEGILALDMKDGRVASSSDDGDLALWTVVNNTLIETQPIDICDTEKRPARCVALYNDSLYWGDDGINIKVWNSNTEELTKLRNHMSEHGSTDALLIAHDLLFATSYNLDTGTASINVRMVSNNMYVMTVHIPWCGPITCLSSPSSEILVCSGSELGVIGRHGTDTTEDLTVELVHGFHDDHTDSVTSDYSDCSDSDDCKECHQQRKQRKEELTETTGSWCTIS